MASMPALDNLPAEMLLDIVGYLRKEDRRNLRLVNH